MKDRGWTPPGIHELNTEAQRCYSVEGLKDFVAKHHPDYVLECRREDRAESAPICLRDCELQVEDDGMWIVTYDYEHFATELLKHGPAAVRVRRKK